VSASYRGAMGLRPTALGDVAASLLPPTQMRFRKRILVIGHPLTVHDVRAAI
jgi:hypothetical protein